MSRPSRPATSETRYRYEIVGRNNDSPGEESYRGECEGTTPKRAILSALAAEFGDSAYGSDPMVQLCDSGWISGEDLRLGYGLLNDQDCMLTLHTADHTFFVSVMPLV